MGEFPVGFLDEFPADFSTADEQCDCGAQRRLCKPPTSSMIAGAQRRLLLCTESVVCGLASHTSRSNSPDTYPSFSSLSDSEPKSLSLVLQLTIFSRSFQPMTKHSIPHGVTLLLLTPPFLPFQLTIFSRSFQPMTKAYMVVVLCTESVVCGLAFHTSRSNSPVTHPSFSSLSGLIFLIFDAASSLFSWLWSCFLCCLAVGGCSKASVCGDAAFLSCELLLLSFFVSGSEWRCDSSSV
ncbi:unnamed protein product [Brassica oleracea var. botrytis]